GDMLMLQGQEREALKEYETSLKNAPMRLRGFHGAAKAAEASGDAKKAREYSDKLASLTKNADSDRPELAGVKRRVSSKQRRAWPTRVRSDAGLDAGPASGHGRGRRHQRGAGRNAAGSRLRGGGGGPPSPRGGEPAPHPL